MGEQKRIKALRKKVGRGDLENINLPKTHPEKGFLLCRGWAKINRKKVLN